MICKNCGLENPDGAKFCAGCGQKIETVPQTDVQQNNASQNNIPQNNVPQNNVPQNNVPQNNVPQNNIPQNNVPQNNVPQNNIPQNNIPQNDVPQNNVPQNNIPQNNVPQNSMPYYNPPQYNNFPNQAFVDPVTGQPVKNNNFKKHLPLIIGIAGGVVAVIVAIVIVFAVIGGSGINGVLDNLEDGVNNKNVESIKKCVPEFVAKDMDIDQDDIEAAFGLTDELNFEVDFDIRNEKDVTDEIKSSNYTWKEYIQDDYEGKDNYDGGEVEEVKEANVKMDVDFDNNIVDSIAGITGALSDNVLSKDIIFVKYDGNWYLYDIDS